MSPLRAANIFFGLPENFESVRDVEFSAAFLDGLREVFEGKRFEAEDIAIRIHIHVNIGFLGEILGMIRPSLAQFYINGSRLSVVPYLQKPHLLRRSMAVITTTSSALLL